MTDQLFDIVDELGRIASELNATVPAVALAWVSSRPGVSAPIMGARTIEHLDGNVKALDITLSRDQIDRLDKLSAPKFPFPVAFLDIAPSLHQGGTSVNGRAAKPHPAAAQRVGDHY